MTRPASVPLAERRAQARMLAAGIRDHQRDCQECRGRAGKCEDRLELDAELREARHDVAHWFDPGPDDVPLW